MERSPSAAVLRQFFARGRAEERGTSPTKGSASWLQRSAGTSTSHPGHDIQGLVGHPRCWSCRLRSTGSVVLMAIPMLPQSRFLRRTQSRRAARHCRPSCTFGYINSSALAVVCPNTGLSMFGSLATGMPLTELWACWPSASLSGIAGLRKSNVDNEIAIHERPYRGGYGHRARRPEDVARMVAAQPRICAQTRIRAQTTKNLAWNGC